MALQTAQAQAALDEYRRRLAYHRKHATPDRPGIGVVKLEQARFLLADAIDVHWLTIQEANALADAPDEGE